MPQNLNSSTILVVDDEARNIHLLKRFLNEAGFANLHTTADSRQALGMYKELHPDLVLLDISMPFLDGFEVMKQFDEARGARRIYPRSLFLQRILLPRRDDGRSRAERRIF